MGTYIIVSLPARFGCKLKAATDDVVPVAFTEAVEIVAVYAILDESVKDACIEVVACADGAHGGDRFNRVVLRKCTTIEINSLRTPTVDEARAVEVDLLFEDFR